MTSDSTPVFALEKEALKTEIETGLQVGVDHLEDKPMKRKPVEKYHNTRYLLKQYRKVAYAIQISESDMNVRMEMEHGTRLSTLEVNAELAGVDLSGSKLEGYARTVIRSKNMLQIIKNALNTVRLDPDHGELMYQILYLTYFSERKLANREAILAELERIGFQMSMVTYHSYLNMAIKAIDRILWGYCAYKDTDATSISKDDMESLLAANKDKLYSFTYTDEVREVPSEPEAESTETVAPDTTTEEPPEPTYETIRVYTISYNGEAYFADQVFYLSDDQKLLASQYAQNLTVLLGDGVYQGLSETEFSAMGLSYDGVIFSDGETQVVYYNQLDERWKYELYGTDTIGGYACGPTAMSIVVSSLTSETVDPPHMAQWAYENGYWCSGNGSYHSLIPGAAEAWGLSVEGCTATEPQRIVDALADGKLVVAIMTKGHFTSSGHFIVLRGCTADGKILVADPSSYKRSEKSWDMSIILNEASKRAGSGGPFWIIGN